MKSFTANSSIKRSFSSNEKAITNIVGYFCAILLRFSFFSSVIYIDAVPIRKRFAIKHFAATRFFSCASLFLLYFRVAHFNTEFKKQNQIHMKWAHVSRICRFLVHSRLNIKIKRNWNLMLRIKGVDNKRPESTTAQM